VHLEREKAQERNKKREVRRIEEEKVVHSARGEAQQEEWKKNLIEELRKRVEEHCDKRVPQGARLLELGWCTKEVIVTYVQCERCGEKKCHVEENRMQGIIKDRQR